MASQSSSSSTAPEPGFHYYRLPPGHKNGHFPEGLVASPANYSPPEGSGKPGIGEISIPMFTGIKN